MVKRKKVSKPIDAFFARVEPDLALTFDDVSLRAGYSEVMPADVDITSRFSRHTPLKMPLVSAAMDTVTEDEMAIAMAELGGLGVIHRNLTPDAQAKQVTRVKYYQHGRINDPITVQSNQTVAEILALKKQERYRFHTFPVIDGEGKLVGILTKHDFDLCRDTAKLAREVMSRKLITSHPRTSAKQAYEIMTDKGKKKLPLVNAQGYLTGLYVHSDVRRAVTENNMGCNVGKNKQLLVGAAIGVNDFERVEKLLERRVDVLVMDTAHADTKSVIKTLKVLKRRYHTIDVVVGNISEGDAAKRLLDAGADGIKVGQGPGSICDTRVIAGIGTPQLTAIYRCAKAAESYGVPVCADGGIVYSGDITKALGAGAHSVMMGSMFAGTDETPGDIVFFEGKQWKDFRGMGSLGAMQKNAASRERYRTGKVAVPEGVEGLKEYKGKLEAVIAMNVGGLRSGMGYIGAATIEELHAKANFQRVTAAGNRESHPHDVMIIKEPPNYRRQ